MSAMRVTMNALAAPARACGSSQACPISRYEQTPMTSQPMSSTNRWSVATTATIAIRNSTMSDA